MTEKIALDVVDSIAYLTVNAPPKNEMDMALFEDLSRVVTTELGTLDVDGVIVRGRGRHFSCGANVSELMEMADRENYRRRLQRNARAYGTLEQFGRPVVAAISGCCLGSGMELALACGYRIAARHAVFALPESSFELMPGCGGTVRLPRLIGKARAMEMILSGRTVLADEAKAMHLVDMVVERSDLMDTAKKVITNYKKNP